MSRTIRTIGRVILWIAIVKGILILLGLGGFILYKHFAKCETCTEEEEEEKTEETA